MQGQGEVWVTVARERALLAGHVLAGWVRLVHLRIRRFRRRHEDADRLFLMSVLAVVLGLLIGRLPG